METKDLFKSALNIAHPWFVSDLTFDEKEKRLDVHIDFVKGSEFGYFDQEEQQMVIGLKGYDTAIKQFRHINFFDHKCTIHARVPRVKLHNGKVKLIITPWEGLTHGFTLLFEVFLIQQCQGMSVDKVAKITQTDGDKIWSMLEKYSNKAKEREGAVDKREKEIFEESNLEMEEAKSRARGYKTLKNYKIIADLLAGKLDNSVFYGRKNMI